MRTAPWLFAAFLGALLVLQSGFDATEAETAIELSRAMRGGRISVDHEPFGPWFPGPDGRWYIAHEHFAPLLAVPAVALGDLGPLPPGVPRDRWFRALEAACGAFIGAAIGTLLFFLFSRRFAIRRDLALAAAVLSVFGSIVLPYSRTNYDGELAGLMLLGALYVGLGESRRAALGAGFLVGLACLARASTAAAAVPVVLALAWQGRNRETLVRLVAYALGALPSGLVLLALNAARTGHALTSPVTLPQFAGNNALVGSFFAGFFGNLVSPGKGLLFYAPLAVAGVVMLVRERRLRVAIAAGGAVLVLAALHAKVRNWSGHWGWGPRYLLPAVPLMLAGVGELVAHVRRRWLVIIAIPSILSAFAPVFVFWTVRIATAGVGNQDAAFGFRGNQLFDALGAIGAWMFGKCPAMSSVQGVSCRPDVWWLGWPAAYGVTWPYVIAAMLFVITIALFSSAIRSVRAPVAGEASERAHDAV